MPTVHEYRRTSGVLLPAASLPGPFGIGDLGPMARRRVDALAKSRQTWWQMLPVGPTGFGDSPYQSPSTFAGNLNLLSPEDLREFNLASPDEIRAAEMPAGPIDYPAVIRHKRRLAAIAYQRFVAGDAPDLRDPFRQFERDEADWLDDYAVFAAIKDRFDGAPWWLWPRPLAMGESEAVDSIARDLVDSIRTHRFGQFLFFRQGERMRTYAAQRGVKLFGDVPIYVAQDSAEVWSHPELFQLDANRWPVVVAGVPPDYFSATGQLWGNPIYDWDVHQRDGFRWWIARLRAALKLFDQVRIDHFRGIEADLAAPAGDATAAGGEWRPGPRDRLLSALRDGLGSLPVVAEDLGFITPGVDELRERFGLSGMRILQFAFGGAVEARFLPHRFTRNLLVATGTHDNDTSRGWFESLTESERSAYEAYVPGASRDPVWSLIRTAWSSVAEQAIAPIQDLLELGSEARMNRPGTRSGNWRWRADEKEVVNPAWVERLADYGRVYERA